MHSQNYNVIDAGIYAKRDYLTCPFFEQEMLKLLYYLWIWSIGLTLIGTLIYGLVNFPPDTITQHMIDQVEYIIILSVCVILQAILSFIYTWAKRNQNKEVILYKYVFLSSIVISRIVLSNILTTATHLVFVYICLCSLFIFLLLRSHITNHRASLIFLRISLLLLSACALAMIILYTNFDFYIPEHIAFLTYSVIFTVFFTVHTYDHW